MPRAKPKKVAPIEQLERFRAMAAEVGADESPGALDRAFGKIEPKKLPKAPAKSK